VELLAGGDFKRVVWVGKTTEILEGQAALRLQKGKGTGAGHKTKPGE